MAEAKSNLSSLEWKIFIKEMSRELTLANVEQLKFLVNEHIPAGVAENIRTSMQFLNALEEHNIISGNDIEFMYTLVKYISRLNLVPKLDNYQKQIELKLAKKVEDKTCHVKNHNRPLSQEFPDFKHVGKKVAKSKSTSSISNDPPLRLMSPNDFIIKSNQPRESQEGSDIGTDETDKMNNDHTDNDNTTERYNMTSEPRGQCIIVNNMFETAVTNDNGHELKLRTGSDKDVATLEKIFKWLKFKVKVYTNVGHGQMNLILEQSAQDDCNKEFDCFVCCILSHGFEKGIYCNDGSSFMLADIKKFFKGDVCQTLLGKPKLFFIQACQGQANGKGQQLASDSPLIPQQQPPEVRVRPPSPKSVSTDADFLFCLATTPGTVSWRDTNIGSWFIQELSGVLKKNAVKKPLYEILLQLNSKIATKEASLGGNQTAKMMSDFGLNTMTKNLYFNPGREYEEH